MSLEDVLTLLFASLLSVILKRLIVYPKIYEHSDMVLAYAVYRKRGFEDLRYHQQEDKKLEEDKFKTYLNQMGQQGQMPRTSEFEPYYTVGSGSYSR